MEQGIVQSLMLMAGSSFTAVCLLFVVARHLILREMRTDSHAHNESDSCVLLFKDQDLVDATGLDLDALGTPYPDESDLARLIRLLTPRFPSIKNFLHQKDHEGAAPLVSDDGTTSLSVQSFDGMMSVSFANIADCGSAQMDFLSLQALEDEVHTLRRIANGAPFLIWQTDVNGEIIWTNPAYTALAHGAAQNKGVQSWPPPELFTTSPIEMMTNTGESHRFSISVPTKIPGKKQEYWYDVISMPQGEHAIHFATNADHNVQAEQAQKNFLQTLTKTFAQLSVGLAIFDKERQLSLFNPALLDMFPLPFEFLSKQPTLIEFLDRLREDRILPEPKDYKSWRKHISDLETSAESGSYCENWTLPDGVVYRIIGRPHPDGAIAFVFEDISAEMLLTRRFRFEIELGRNVIDTLDQAIAVFRSDGVLILANDRYEEIWGMADETRLLEQNIVDVSARWQSMCETTSIWPEICNFVRHAASRKGWERTIKRKDGSRLSCRLSALKSGDTVVQFTLETAQGSMPRNSSWTPASHTHAQPYSPREIPEAKPATGATS